MAAILNVSQTVGYIFEMDHTHKDHLSNGFKGEY
jgi:hypothetical protein